MALNSIKKIALFATVTGLFAAVSISAQPAKQRGAGSRPAAPRTTPTAPAAPVAQPAPTTTAVAVAAPKPSEKKTIVVLDFNDVNLGLDTTKRAIGKQLAALLTAEFTRRGNFIVISQRDKEKAVAEEQNRSKSDRRAKSYEAEIGQILSANIVVFGDILEYTITTQNTGLGYFGQTKHEAKVGFTLNLVDVNTSEIKDAATIEDTANSKDTAIMGMGNVKTLTEDQKTSMLTAASKKAVAKAVSELVRLIEVPAAGGASPSYSAPPAASAQTESAGENTSTAPAPTQTADKSEDKKKGGVFGGITGMFGKKDKKDKKEKVAPNQPSVAAQPVTASNSAAPAAASQAKVVLVSENEIYVSNLPAGLKPGTPLIVYTAVEITDEEGKVVGTKKTESGRLEIVKQDEGLYICKIVSGAGVKKSALVKLAN